jgi:hypothetical protein
MGFTLLEQLGRGGMGPVWKARDEDAGQIVSVELLEGLSAERLADRQRFERAVEVIGQIGSAYVSRMIGSGVHEGVPCLAFEAPEGPSFRERLDEQGPRSWDEVRAILKPLALGLVRAHAAGAVAHGVALEDVVVGADGLVKLAGHALAVAPEGAAAVDPQEDLYGLGGAAFELLSGEPFTGGGAAGKGRTPDLSKLPEEARPIVGWLLAADPAARPQSAQDFLMVLSGQRPVPAATDVKTRQAAAAVTAAAAAAVPPPPVAPPPVPPPPPVGPAVPVAVPSPKAAPIAVAAGGRRRPVVLALGGAAVVIFILSLLAVAAGLPGSGKPTPIYVVSQGPTPSPEPTPTPVPTPKPPLSTYWTVVGQIPRDMWGSGIAELPDGRVLVFDCLRNVSNYSFINTQTGAVSSGGAMPKCQESAGMAVLQDGSILAIGGFDVDNYPIATVERFNPGSMAWEVLPSLNQPRAYPTVTVLADGRVLVAGGWALHPASGWTAAASAEIYNSATNTWSSAGSMATPRALASASRLADGRVLVTGGASSWTGTGVSSMNLAIQSSAEIYDPGSGTWQAVSSMAQPRATHTSVTLASGQVMVMGGWGNASQQGLASTEVFDPATGTWYAAPGMLSGHGQARLVQLLDGRPMVIGGVDAAANVTAETEVFDPDLGVWESSGNLTAAVYWPLATSLEDGRVMVVGGPGYRGKYVRTIQTWVGPAGHGGLTRTGPGLRRIV